MLWAINSSRQGCVMDYNLGQNKIRNKTTLNELVLNPKGAIFHHWNRVRSKLDQNLKWNDHVKSLLTSCYGTLSILRKLKNLAPFYVRKNLAESLVTGKLDYASTVFYPLLQYQVDRLQRLQNACAGFVLRKYAGPEDLAYLNWLPISERRDFNILKLTRRSIAVIFQNTYHWNYATYIHIIWDRQKRHCY